MLVESESWQVYQEEPQFFPDIKQTIKPIILYHVVRKIVNNHSLTTYHTRDKT